MASVAELVQAKNNSVGTNLTANLPNVSQQTANTFQNNNNSALSKTNYQNLTPNVDTSAYKNQLSNALSNSKYHDITTNTVGMDNTPYVNQVNNAVNNSNPIGYQSAVQSALNKYNGVSTSGPSAQDILNNSKDATQYYSDMEKYYPEQLKQIRVLQQLAVGNATAGQDNSGVRQQYQNIISSAPQQTTQTNNIYTPKDNSSFESDMTNRINNLYNTQKDNVGLYYQTGINQAKQQYAGLRNQASVTDQQNLNKLKESMAQQGLFNSGDNITAQTGINNQYANDLSGYNTQEQNYYDNTNNQIAQQKAQYDAQMAQALMDLGYKADDRSFKMANLQDTRNQNTFNNSMVGINAQYGMNQDNVNNNLKGTSMTYGMGRDNVSDQKYNNDSSMQADQINYGRNQDQFNNTLKTIAQQYGMDQDQVNNLLKYAQFNSSEDQRQYQNSTSTNNSNYGMYQDNTKNNQAQQQINLSDRNAQWSNSQWAQDFVEKKRQYDEQFDYKKQQDALAQQIAAARAASGGSGRSGGSSRSSKGSGDNGDYSNTDYKNSNQQSLNSYANNNSYTLAQKLQALSGYANSEGVDPKDAQYAKEQQQALLDGRWYR